MRTHVKKSNFIALALLVSAQIGFAQNKPAPPANPGPATPAAPTTGSPTEIDTSTDSILNNFMHVKPGEGTGGKATSDIANALADKLKADDALNAPVLNDPETKARFDTYLSLKEIPEDRIKEYFDKMAQVSETLKANDTFTAWKMLYALSEYKDLDAGISRELAHRVESIWNSDRTQTGLAKTNDQLQDNIETYDQNADLIADELHTQDLQERQQQQGSNGKNNGNSGNQTQANNTNQTNTTNSPLLNPNADPDLASAATMPTMSGALQRKMELTGEYLKLLEARAKIKLNEIQANRMSDQDRVDFANYIKTLYHTHRFYHVIIAADFYRALFNTGDYPADLGNQAVAAATGNANGMANGAMQVANTVGVNNRGVHNALNQAGNALGVDHFGQTADASEPTTLPDEVTSALEINQRVSDAIDVFKYKAAQGDIAQASTQLQEAFVGNEFHPGLQGLPRADKEKVGDFLAKLDVLKNQLSSRVFEQVDAQIADIKKVASDFDSTKAEAMVNDIKLESRLRLGKAKLLAQSGQLDDAMKEFQTAAEEWPGNPALQTSSTGFFDKEDVQNQSTTDFDRMVQEKNYRGIFDNQLAYALAIKGDATREQQLKDALTKVQKAEMASEKANQYVMNGDVDGAWEIIQLAVKDWPDDMKLNKLLADLSSRSADFVSALNKAQDAESKKELGYSLTWYVNAQAKYPASQIANEGIDRVSKLILAPQGPATDAPAATN